MASLSENLKILMTLAKINASELARRTGIAQPIIHRLSTGQNVNPKLATIKPVANYFMITISQLVGEDPLPSDQVYIKTSPENRSWTRVPMISWKDAIEWPSAITRYENSVDSVYVSTDAKVSKLAYGLLIKGRSMEPIFPEGTTIIIEPKRKPNDRDFVVVHIAGEEEARLKQVIVDGKDLYLKSLNPELDTMKLMQISSTEQFLGVMAQAKVDF